MGYVYPTDSFPKYSYATFVVMTKVSSFEIVPDCSVVFGTIAENISYVTNNKVMSVLLTVHILPPI